MSKVWVTFQIVLSVSRSAGLPVAQCVLPKSPALNNSVPWKLNSSRIKAGCYKCRNICDQCKTPVTAPADIAPLVSSSGERFWSKNSITGNPAGLFSTEIRAPWGSCKRLSFWLHKIKIKQKVSKQMASTLHHIKQSTNIIHSKSSLNLKPGGEKTKKAKKPRKPKPINPQKAPKQANLYRIYLKPGAH